MNQTSTRSRATHTHRSERVIDITDAAMESRSVRSTPAGSRDVLEVRALLFAHGIDERGRRLPLATDSMSEEERRPHHIVAARQGAQRRPEEFAAVYRIADCFDDDQPNVSNVCRLTHKVRVATSDQSTMSKAGAPRFTPREAPTHLRAVPQIPQIPQTRQERPVDRRTTLAPSASVAMPTRMPTRMPQGMPQRNSHKTTGELIGTGRTDGSVAPTALGAVGALALARAVPVESKPEPTVSPRTPLRAVASSPKRSGSYGVVAFWLMFVIAFLFVAVVMHAGIARQQMTLDEINVSLEQSEFLNSQLRVEVASLQSPTRIAEAAARLGLSAPKDIRFVQAVPASAVPVAPTEAVQPADSADSTQIGR